MSESALDARMERGFTGEEKISSIFLPRCRRATAEAYDALSIDLVRIVSFSSPKLSLPFCSQSGLNQWNGAREYCWLTIEHTHVVYITRLTWRDSMVLEKGLLFDRVQIQAARTFHLTCGAPQRNCHFRNFLYL
jgi:hypothetical protein